MFVFVMISQLIIKGGGAFGGGWSSTFAHPLDIASTGLRAGEIDELCRGNVGGGGAGVGENGRVQGGGGDGVGLSSRILPIGSTASSSSSSSSTANGIMADEAKLLDQRPCFTFVPRRCVQSTLEPPPSGGARANGSWCKTKAKPFATAGLASVDHFLGPLSFKDRVGNHHSVSLFQAYVSPHLFVAMSTIILVINGASLRKWILVQGGRRLTMHPTIVFVYFAPVVYYASQLDALRYDEEGATAFERAVRYNLNDLMPLLLR